MQWPVDHKLLKSPFNADIYSQNLVINYGSVIYSENVLWNRPLKQFVKGIYLMEDKGKNS